MTQQYLRNLSLIVADPAGSGLELGSLRVVFSVRRGDQQTPNTTDIRVYNLSPSTANRIKTEFTQLSLKASYGNDPPQLIFQGSIKQVRKGRENQLNSYVDITAADGDEAYNFAPVALTLAAGSSPKTAIEQIISNMAKAATFTSPTGQSQTNSTGSSSSTPRGPQSIKPGYLPNFSPNRSLRGRTYYGMCRDELRELAQNNDCKWSIQDGQVTFIPNTAPIPGAIVLISPGTGLIGVPEQTPNGLNLRVLLNPSIKIGQRVKLDSTDVNQLRYSLDLQSTSHNLNRQISETVLNADGLYYVMRADHVGDTRGPPWYTDLLCLAVNASVPAESFPESAILPSNAIPRY